MAVTDRLGLFERGLLTGDLQVDSQKSLVTNVLVELALDIASALGAQLSAELGILPDAQEFLGEVLDITSFE